MSELRELYQEVILDHNKSPRNFREIPDADHVNQGHNPLCGDNVTIYLKVRDGVIDDLSFQGSGCAISKSSASMMTAALKGKTEEEAETIFQSFHRMVTGENATEEDEQILGKLAVFGGVREFPARVKCASLAWHTLHAAINEEKTPVSTE
jgi:nitrogen fixation NifU-like protein